MSWPAVSVALGVTAAAPGAWADQTVRTLAGEFIAITVEAESADEADERWTVTDSTTPQTEPDPDGNHSDGAGGGVYLELLPDNRVTHADEDFPPDTPGYYWGKGGDGPQMSYNLNFPEPGRWYVHARAYQTGSEDNGIHVGLNGDWPASGRQMQWCHPREWWWSSQQRGTVDRHCGLGERTIWLDVPSAGEHVVAFGAREDGFELDRFMLIKDLSDGRRECLPKGLDDIDCGDGAVEAIDGFVDLGVKLELATVVEDAGKQRELRATVKNHEGETPASIVSLEIELSDAWTLVEADERCSLQSDTLACDLDELDAGDVTVVPFTLEGTRGGTLPITASVSGNESDDNPDNDSAGVDVEIVLYPALNASLTTGEQSMTVDEQFQVEIGISNVGEGEAVDVAAVLSLPDEIAVSSVSEQCTNARPIVCSLASMEPGEEAIFNAALAGSEPSGSATLELAARAEGVEPVAESLNMEIVAAPAPAPVVTAEAETNEQETTEQETTEEQTTEGDQKEPEEGTGVTAPEPEGPTNAANQGESDSQTQVAARSSSSGIGALGAGLLLGLAGAACARTRRRARGQG